ncbi:MAG: DUF4832 domain-containing protein [Verrucomicrobiales bacterium]|nr:DUF4832 domain-containing protein [Verrucomicrobiales bacterium]
MSFSFRCIAAAVLLSVMPVHGDDRLEYQPAPPDNPLKGLVPYVEADGWDQFPHSLEFHYFSIRDLMTGYDEFNWSPIEEKLAITQARGCQLTFRVMMEYPGKPNQIPQFLIDEGVKITKWKREAADGGDCHTPDYDDPRLRRALVNFITALGEKYDGDPRIGFLTAGILGLWGEWHNHPRVDLMAKKEAQEIVMAAFEKAFTRTPVLLRYPAGENDYHYAPNAKRRFGFHDDSFDWATLDTGRPEDDWFFIPLLKNAGALDRWKQFPVGGEIRPELWEKSFTDSPHPRAQGFDECVRQTHVTWLMDSGLFEKRFPLPETRKQRAIKEVQRMGYEFHISNWRKTDAGVEIDVENRGVAPFYHDWKAELHSGASLVTTFELRGILPGETKTWKAETKGDGPFKLRVPNPMEGGKPLRFANEEQGDEWLTLP